MDQNNPLAEGFLLAAGDSEGATALMLALAFSAALAFGYRVYRLSKGGPLADAVGGAILASMLVTLGVLASTGAGWVKWAALVYALLFALVVMPIWILGVYIPARPTTLDHALVGSYLLSLIAVAIAALGLG